MAKQLKIALILLLTVLTSSGCVYYNTFFLAKKNYNQAEKLRKKAGGDQVPSTAKPKYEKAVEKATKVLQFYMESEYVDDALFMMGMSYLRLGDYTKALSRFNELLANYTNSAFAEEARYWRNVCLYYGGQEEAAVESLTAYAEENPEKAEEALFMIGELAYGRKEYIAAKNAFLNFVDAFGKSKTAAKARLRLGQIEWHYENYKSALEHLEEINTKDLDLMDFYTRQILLARCYVHTAQLAKAEKICTELLKDQSFMEFWGEVELVLGELELARNNPDGAQKIWEEIPKKYPRSKFAAQAYFNLGELFFDMGLLERAMEMFDAASKESSDPEIRKAATDRGLQIAKILEKRRVIAASQDPKTEIEAELSLAEIFLTELAKPDSAIAAYARILQKYPTDTLAPKAHYSLGWVWAYSKKDMDRADSVFSDLLVKYPESDYAVGAADYFISSRVSLDSLRAKNVAFYFVKAEEFWLTRNMPDSALHYYTFVSDTFPKSRWAPKAIAARAEIMRLRGENEIARELYTRLAEKYPQTQYDSLAKFMLGQGSKAIASKLEKPGTKTETIAAPDSFIVAENETIRNTFENLPKAPRRTLKKLKLRYPESEWSTRYQGRVVRLRIKIDPFGKVSEAEILASCGSDVIDKAALLALQKAEFDPADLDIGLFGQWLLYEFRAEKPTPAWEWDE